METSQTRRKPAAAPNFRALLQTELVDRCRKNPGYSLRAFARSLGVEASALSQIISGKRPLTDKMRIRLGSALGLPLTRIKNIPADDDGRTEGFQQITLDQFAVISDWYHYAILELTNVVGFKSEAAWISKRLGITKLEANVAVERLMRLGLLEERNGRWIDASENGELTHIAPSLTSSASKKYQCQLLELSKAAVHEIGLERRNHTSATLVFDSVDMDSAIERIKQFRRSFAKEFQPSSGGTDVYQIQISFFPLTIQSEVKRELP
jgi:transcriptional regulator with XRE-family HTH domain